MAKVNKIDSNVTGLSYAEEQTIGVLPVSPIWNELEPNSYSDFGGEITKVARNPINPSRQKKKGASVGVTASGGINTDFTQTNLQDLLQGFLFADTRIKAEQDATAITSGGVNNDYTVADESGFVVGDLIFSSGFSDSSNNGLKNVDTVSSGTVSVSQTLVDDGSPSGAKITKVGVQAAAGDIDVDSTGTLPALTSTVLDFTTLGLIIGEWIFIGGDSSSLSFSNSENNGFARVRSVSANRMEFDKTESTMVDESSTSETIQIFFGKVLRNEKGSLIKRRSYQLERTLGAPDDALPSEIQSEYLVGAVPSEMTINYNSEDKLNVDLSFIALDVEQRDGPTGVKTGDRVLVEEVDAFNSSSDFARIKLAKVIEGNPAPEDLFAFAEEMTVTLTNNLEGNKALGVFGSFDMTAGTFEVGGSMTAYLSDLTAVSAVRNNDDITLDIHVVRENKGISIDVPLISLGDGKSTVEQDQAVKLPLSVDASTARKIDDNLDFTLEMIFWDYLPNAAQ